MAITIEKKTLGFVVLLTALLAGSAGVILDSESPYYQCNSKGLISDCVNGVKACSGDICTRCYANITNKMSYENCKEGWKTWKPSASGNNSFTNAILVCELGKACKKVVLADSSKYKMPIDCLREERYCPVKVEGENERFYLSQIGCNMTVNPLCEAQYIIQVTK